MIKRTYFMSAHKPHDDGNGSYAFMYVTITQKSWFPHPKDVLDDGVEHFSKKFAEKGVKGEGIDIQAFNRI